MDELFYTCNYNTASFYYLNSFYFQTSLYENSSKNSVTSKKPLSLRTDRLEKVGDMDL